MSLQLQTLIRLLEAMRTAGKASSADLGILAMCYDFLRKIGRNKKMIDYHLQMFHATHDIGTKEQHLGMAKNLQDLNQQMVQAVVHGQNHQNVPAVLSTWV